VNAAEVVTIQHLVKRYGNVLAVNDVSFSICEGEIFGIIVQKPLGVAHWHAQGMSHAASVWRASLEGRFWNHTISAKITWRQAQKKQMAFWTKTALAGGRDPQHLKWPDTITVRP
jgi:hypothetical protein